MLTLYLKIVFCSNTLMINYYKFIFQTGEQIHNTLVNSVSGIRVCRWSPDGTKLATGGDDEKTTIWDTGTLEELR